MDRLAFLSAYNELFTDRQLDMVSAENLFVFLGMLREDPHVRDPHWRAYMLATARHETGSDFRCRREVGPVSYFAMYEPGTPRGKALGNTQPGDGYRYRGAGYPQTTGRANFAKYGELLGIDLVGDPEAANMPSVSYRILSAGMTGAHGSRYLFTGKKLGDYFNAGKTDPIQARRTVNGVPRGQTLPDKAELIAGYYAKFYKIIIRPEVQL